MYMMVVVEDYHKGGIMLVGACADGCFHAAQVLRACHGFELVYFFFAC
jgi:hypothetical protein